MPLVAPIQAHLEDGQVPAQRPGCSAPASSCIHTAGVGPQCQAGVGRRAMHARVRTYA